MRNKTIATLRSFFFLLRTISDEIIEVPPSAFQYKDSLISNLAYTKFEAAVSYMSLFPTKNSP